MKKNAEFSPAAQMLERAAGFITAITGRFSTPDIGSAERAGVAPSLLEPASPAPSPSERLPDDELRGQRIELFTEKTGIAAERAGRPLPVQTLPPWDKIGVEAARDTERTSETLHSVTDRMQAVQNTAEVQSRSELQTERIGNLQLQPQLAKEESAGESLAHSELLSHETKSSSRIAQSLLSVQQSASFFGGQAGQESGKAAAVFMGASPAERYGAAPYLAESKAAEKPTLLPLPQAAASARAEQGEIPVYQEISNMVRQGGGTLYGGDVLAKADKALAVDRIADMQSTFSTVNARSSAENATAFSEQAAASLPPLQGISLSDSSYEESRETMPSLRELSPQPQQGTAAATEIKIDMSGMCNQIHTDTDVDEFLELLTGKLEKALVSTAEGIHV